MSTIDERIRIAVDSSSIDGTLITPGTLVPGVLFIHGWGGSQEQYLARARHIAGLGCICLTFDLRGHAATKDRFETVSREANLRDVQSAYDMLAGQPHVDRSSIAIVGSSYGGYLGAILTAMRPVRWLSLRAPALYLDDGWGNPKLQLHKDQDLHSYRRRPVAAISNRALSACLEFSGDALLVESEHDDIVPHAVLDSYREALVKARSVSYRCIDGADHGLSSEVDQTAFTQILISWLKEMLAGARKPAVNRDAPARGSQTSPEQREMPETPPKEMSRGD